MDWVRGELAPCDWGTFFKQIKLGLYGPLRWLFTSEAPRLGEIRPNANPLKVIEECKDESAEKASMPDVLNHHVAWLARWIQRIIPDRRLMLDALDAAERKLLREAWAGGWG